MESCDEEVCWGNEGGRKGLGVAPNGGKVLGGGVEGSKLHLQTTPLSLSLSPPFAAVVVYPVDGKQSQQIRLPQFQRHLREEDHQSHQQQTTPFLFFPIISSHHFHQNHPLQFSHPWQHARPDPPFPQTHSSTPTPIPIPIPTPPPCNSGSTPIPPRLPLSPPSGSDPDPLTLPKPNKDFSPSSSLSPSPSPKPNRFVPPHLRPGFVGREEKPGPELQKQQGVRSREFGGHFGSPNKHGEEGRPKSGGGYERMRRVGDSGPVEMNRPRSSGTRPSSSG
ncbi:hypothetical protein LOK49_LG07G02088 [Camellia lanceoleosa]|uniref:Uncharacterized protein n=1 Tax=Camellia lanceoleosa TaxID=1840588 RepID=A0ACC0H3W4_9ERIC|nr:hypothetical protein LOK49_LG07G02088 [Camellia lanceoleosa]